MKDTLIYNNKGFVLAKADECVDDMLSRIVHKTVDIADLVAVVSAVVGHVQVLVNSSAGRALVTVTKTTSPNIRKSTYWLGREHIDMCEVTIDVVSHVNTDAPVKELVERFIV